MAVSPLSPQDVADCVNVLGLTKDQFTRFLSGAVLLAQRNQVQAQIEQANAQANAAAVALQDTIAGLQAQLQQIDAQYRAAFGG